MPLQDLREAKRSAAVALLASAFVEYPPFVHICGGADGGGDRAAVRAFLAWKFQRYVLAVMAVPGGRALVDPTGQCVSLVLPPDPTPGAALGFRDLSIASLLWYGLWELPFRFGLRALWRTLTVLGELEAAEQAITAQLGPFWFQDYLAVDPSTQGNGLGGLCLEHTMAEITRSACGTVSPPPDAATAGHEPQLPIVLNTFDERAARFYRNHGFTELGSHVVGGSRVFWFARCPRAPTPAFELPAGWRAGLPS